MLVQRKRCMEASGVELDNTDLTCLSVLWYDHFCSAFYFTMNAPFLQKLGWHILCLSLTACKANSPVGLQIRICSTLIKTFQNHLFDFCQGGTKWNVREFKLPLQLVTLFTEYIQPRSSATQMSPSCLGDKVAMVVESVVIFGLYS